MRTTSADYSSLANAYQNKYAVQRGADRIKTYRSQDAIRKTDNIISTINNVISVAQAGAKLAGNINNLVQENQTQEVNKSLTDWQTQYQQAVTTSIANNKTYFRTNDETGEAQLVIDQDILDMQSDYRSQIEASDYTKKIKQSALQSLDSMFASSQGSMLTQALQRQQQATNSAFDVNLNTNAYNLDLQTPIGENGYSNGFAVISSRKDLSENEKSAYMASYKAKVDYGKAGEIVGLTARTEGTAAAKAKALELKQQYSFTENQYQALVYSGNASASLESASVLQMATDAFSSALDANASPAAAKAEILQSISSQPQERKEAVETALDAKHVQWAQKQIVPYTTGLDNMTRDELVVMKGLLEDSSPMFSGGAESVKDSAVSVIDSYIAQWDKSDAAAAKTAESESLADIKKRVADQTSYMNNAYLSFQNGEISGKTAIQLVTNYANVDESDEDNTKAFEFIGKVIKEAVPASQKAFADDMLAKYKSSLLDSMGFKDTSKMDADQLSDYYSAVTWANGAIADLFLSTSTSSLSVADIGSQFQSILDSTTAKTLDIVSAGTLYDHLGALPVSGAYDAQEAFASGMYVYPDPQTGQYRWQSSDVKQTFDDMTTAFKGVLEDNGIEVAPVAGLLEADGYLLAIPVFQGTDGKRYMVSREGIFRVTDNGKAELVPKTAEGQQSMAVNNQFTGDAETVAEAQLQVNQVRAPEAQSKDMQTRDPYAYLPEGQSQNFKLSDISKAWSQGVTKFVTWLFGGKNDSKLKTVPSDSIK